MKVFLRYIKYELKRSIKVLPTIVGSMIFMFLFILILAFSINNYIYKSNLFEPITIGLVMPEDESRGRAIASLVGTIDSVKNTSEFEYMSEEEALSRIEEGNLEAAIILNHEFFETVYSGYNAPARVVFSAHSTLNTEVFRGLLDVGESLIRITEAGAYSVADITIDSGVEDSWSHVATIFFYQYMEAAFNRGDLFIKTVLSPTGNVTFSQYYFVLIILCFLLMNGLNYGYLYLSKSNAVEERLRFIGVNNFKENVSKILIHMSSLYIFTFAVYFLSLIITSRINSFFLIFDYKIFITIIPVLFSIASFIHLIYVLSGSKDQNGILLLFINIVMIVCSGGIIPTVFLPKIIQNIGRYLPFSFWNNYLSKIMFDQVYIKDISLALITGLIFTTLGVIKTWENT